MWLSRPGELLSRRPRGFFCWRPGRSVFRSGFLSGLLAPRPPCLEELDASLGSRRLSRVWGRRGAWAGTGGGVSCRGGAPVLRVLLSGACIPRPYGDRAAAPRPLLSVLVCSLGEVTTSWNSRQRLLNSRARRGSRFVRPYLTPVRLGRELGASLTGPGVPLLFCVENLAGGCWLETFVPM